MKNIHDEIALPFYSSTAAELRRSIDVFEALTRNGVACRFGPSFYRQAALVGDPAMMRVCFLTAIMGKDLRESV